MVIISDVIPPVYTARWKITEKPSPGRGHRQHQRPGLRPGVRPRPCGAVDQVLRPQFKPQLAPLPSPGHR